MAANGTSGAAFERLGSWIYRRRRIVAVAWLAALIVSVMVGSGIFGRLSTEMRSGDSESGRAADRLVAIDSEAWPNDVIAVIDGADVEDEGVAASVVEVAAELTALDGVELVLDRYSTGLDALTSADRRASVVAVELEEGASGHVREEVVHALLSIHAPSVTVGGDAVLAEEFVEGTERDLNRAEMSTLPVIMILLVLIFGGLIAAGLPLGVAFVAIPGAFLVLFGISYLTDVAFYAVSVVTMLGLGLSVDYALLMVNRFREERAAGADIEAAVVRTVATAGRTVFFSGLTVTVALAGLLVYPDSGLRTLTYGGSGVVVVAMAAALTLLPALLGMWGRRVRVPRRAADGSHGFFYRLSRSVQRRAVLVIVLVGAVLAGLWMPFLAGARLENGDVRSLPRSSTSRQVYETLQARFGMGGTEPVTVVADVDADAPAFAAFAERVAGFDGVTATMPREGTPSGIAVLDVFPEGPTQGETATSLVEAIRRTPASFPKAVTGQAAALVDYEAMLLGRLPWALGLIMLASFVLLFLMTGSVVVPAKAIVMNVLSLGATMGALVWGFQEGHLAGLLDFDPTGALVTFVPLIVFVFSYGLSMDYEVFLLSRIKEIYDETGDNDEAVALGLDRTGRIVTSAAALIVVVFLGFAIGDMLTMKQLGVGLALAVVLDVTVIRGLLVPATMKLMGDRNWWAPAWMRRIHDRFGISETEPVLAEPAAAELPESEAVPA
jgi:putative drug exporter of the RND superfamily